MDQGALLVFPAFAHICLAVVGPIEWTVTSPTNDQEGEGANDKERER